MSDPPQDRLPPPAFLTAPAPAAVLAALPGSRAVGGCVRDALAGREVHDIDVAAPLPPEAIARRLVAAGLRVFETGLSHGTVTAVLDHQPVEVTALRRDVLTDGRHAEVAWTTDWREDAERRDFTINAMSMDRGGALWDYFTGREDLAAGRVRFVGDAATRLAEDYLRALRFFRFQARYGRGAPDEAAVAAIRASVPGLAILSVERVWSELKRLLAAPDPTEALALMAETGVLGAVLPEAVPPSLADLGRAIAAGAPPAAAVLRLAALLRPDSAGRGGAIAARLKLSGEERDALAALHDAPVAPPEDPAPLAWLATRGTRERALADAFLAEARDGRDRAPLRAWIAATPVPELPVQGRDALALGLPPGPGIGRLMRELRDWWLAGGCVADRAACLARLRELAGLPAL